MKNWNKKQVPREIVAGLNAKYGIDALTASILARRGITEGKDVQFFMEDNERFMHSPFLFKNMEEVVDRILQAKDEGEKVLIFGDRDVDGITSTTVLHDFLTSLGMDVTYRLPAGADPYGLNMGAIDDFAAAVEEDFKRGKGALIITVDCGISNVSEISYATEKGMEVIVLDHHNPPEVLPEPAIIIDPKCEDSGYPFKDISGCAVAYKVVSALRFALAEPIYGMEIALLDANVTGGDCVVDVIRTKNLTERGTFSVRIPQGKSIMETELPNILRNQHIYIWDKAKFSAIFGTDSFNFADFRDEIMRVWPERGKLSLRELRARSKIALYNPEFDSDIMGFFNLFVTYHSISATKEFSNENERDLQLVALAALADIMPLVDENRIFVRRGIASINAGNAREGLRELLALAGLLSEGRTITSTDLSWNINPALNATGRLGQPEIGLGLLTEKESDRRISIANRIIAMNNERKQFGADAWEYGNPKAQESIDANGGKLCVIVDERINRGVSGILAGKLVSAYNVPAMAMTFVDGTAIGSMRSCRSFDATAFLDALDKEGAKDGKPGLFISHGGHDYAAGFSFEKSRLDEFLSAVKKFVPSIKLSDDDTETFDIDAELPQRYLDTDEFDIFTVIDRFEPYGEENAGLIFMSRSLRISDAKKFGKPESRHLKLTFDCGRTKWPALLWNGAESLDKDFSVGDCVDVIYNVERNFYNGNTTPQMKIIDIRRAGA